MNEYSVTVYDEKGKVLYQNTHIAKSKPHAIKQVMNLAGKRFIPEDMDYVKAEYRYVRRYL